MKKILFFVLFLVISIFILSEFVGDNIIKGILEKNISSSIDRKTEINDLKISYLKGEAVIKKISVNKFSGYFFLKLLFMVYLKIFFSKY